jgi:predicted transcriptional regulator
LPEEDAADKLVQQADPSDVKRLCDRYGLRREDLGRMTGFSLRALADWSAGKLPSEPARRRLHEIRRLLDSLAQVVKPEAISLWLRQRNPAFEKMTPMQVIEVGEIDRLWQMVHHMSSDSID